MNVLHLLLVVGFVAATGCPEGGCYFAAAIYGRAYVLNIHSGENKNLHHDDWVNTVAFSPDGTQLISSSDDYSAKIWNIETGELLGILAHEDWVLDAEFSPDGRNVVTVCKDRGIRLWDIENQTLEHTLFNDGFTPVAKYSQDGSKILTSCRYKYCNSLAKVWDTATGTLEYEISHAGMIVDIAWSHNQAFLASISKKELKIWDEATGEVIELKTFDAAPTAIVVQNGHLALGLNDSSIHSYNTTNDTPSTYFHVEPVNTLLYSRNGKFLIGTCLHSGCVQLEISIVELENGTVHRIMNAYKVGYVTAIRLSQNSNYLAISAFDGKSKLYLWNLESMQLVFQYDYMFAITVLEFSPDSTHIACSNSFDTILYSTSSGEIFQLAFRSATQDIAFSPLVPQTALNSTYEGREVIQICNIQYLENIPCICDDMAYYNGDIVSDVTRCYFQSRYHGPENASIIGSAMIVLAFFIAYALCNCPNSSVAMDVSLEIFVYYADICMHVFTLMNGVYSSTYVFYALFACAVAPTIHYSVTLCRISPWKFQQYAGVSKFFLPPVLLIMWIIAGWLAYESKMISMFHVQYFLFENAPAGTPTQGHSSSGRQEECETRDVENDRVPNKQPVSCNVYKSPTLDQDESAVLNGKANSGKQQNMHPENNGHSIVEPKSIELQCSQIEPSKQVIKSQNPKQFHLWGMIDFPNRRSFSNSQGKFDSGNTDVENERSEAEHNEAAIDNVNDEKKSAEKRTKIDSMKSEMKHLTRNLWKNREASEANKIIESSDASVRNNVVESKDMKMHHNSGKPNCVNTQHSNSTDTKARTVQNTFDSTKTQLTQTNMQLECFENRFIALEYLRQQDKLNLLDSNSPTLMPNSQSHTTLSNSIKSSDQFFNRRKSNHLEQLESTSAPRLEGDVSNLFEPSIHSSNIEMDPSKYMHSIEQGSVKVEAVAVGPTEFDPSRKNLVASYLSTNNSKKPTPNEVYKVMDVALFNEMVLIHTFCRSLPFVTLLLYNSVTLGTFDKLSIACIFFSLFNALSVIHKLITHCCKWKELPIGIQLFYKWESKVIPRQ